MLLNTPSVLVVQALKLNARGCGERPKSHVGSHGSIDLLPTNSDSRSMFYSRGASRRISMRSILLLGAK